MSASRYRSLDPSPNPRVTAQSSRNVAPLEAVVGRRGVGVIFSISDVCRRRLAQIAGGAALAGREKQDRANAADENQDRSAYEDSDSEKRRSKAHHQTRQVAPDTWVSQRGA
jgi:hypothetical protein